MSEHELMEKPRFLRGSPFTKFMKVIFITVVILLVLAASLPAAWRYFSASKEADPVIEKDGRVNRRNAYIYESTDPVTEKDGRVNRRNALGGSTGTGTSKYIYEGDEEEEEHMEEGSDNNGLSAAPNSDFDAYVRLISLLDAVEGVSDETDPRFSMIDLAIQAGAKPNQIFHSNESAVMYAARNWMLPALKRMGPINFEAEFYSLTVMHCVAINVPTTEEEIERATNTVQYLIKAGGNVNAKFRNGLKRPLEYARSRCNGIMVKLLIENGDVSQ